jgi:Tfp pilus assembly protein PilN
MRDMEFLPDWYPQTRRRRRLVVLLGWLTMVLVGGMGAHKVLADRNIAAADKALLSLRGQLDQTNAQLVEMDKLDSMRLQLKQQEQVVSRLGFYVYATKAVDTLDRLLPKQMSLTGMQLENEEKVDTSAIQQAKGGEAAVDRRLKVRIQGVCPTDVDLAEFMTELSTIKFFDQVSVTYARDKSDNGHVLREFEVSFVLNLNGAGS